MQTSCPNGHRVEVPADEVGRSIPCPVCHETVMVNDRSVLGGSTATTTATRTAAVGNETDERRRTTAATRPGWAPWQRAMERWNFELLDQLRPVAQLVLLLGLVIALAARGWDAVGDRSVTAAQAAAEHAENEWYDEWEDRFDRISQEETTIRNKEDLTSEDQDRLNSLRRQRQRLQGEQQDDRAAQIPKWNALQREARESSTENKMAGPWREGLFVLGSILFSLGLLVLGFTSEGPVRWMCLVLLAIVVLSVYFGSIWEHGAVSGVNS